MRLMGLLLLSFLFGAAQAEAEGVAYIIDSAAAQISVVDMTSLKEVRRIPVLREPHHIMPTPDGKSLIVGDTTGNELVFLDPDRGTIQQRLTITDPYQFAFSPNHKFLVINGLARNQVDVYDAATYKLIKRFPAKSTPSHLDYTPDSSRVFISLQDSDRLMAIDLRKMEVVWNEPVGKTPAGVQYLNGKVLVANMGSDSLAQVDPATGKVVATIPTGKGAHNLFLSPDGKILWVNNRAGGTTVSLDAATLKKIRSYTIPGGPDDIAFAPDGKLWITRRFAEKVAVLDPVTGSFETIAVGRSPHGLFLNPNGPAPGAAVSSR